MRMLSGLVAAGLIVSAPAFAVDPVPFDLTLKDKIPISGVRLAVDDAGFIWTVDHARRMIVTIDPATGERNESEMPHYNGFALPMLFGDGAAWVPDMGTAAVLKLDGATGRELGVVGAGLRSQGAAYADGSVWIGTYDADADKQLIVRYDAATGAEQARIETGDPVFNLIGAGDYVWVNRLRQLVRLDPQTNAITGGPAGEFDYPMWAAEGSLFAQSSNGDTLYRIDPATGAASPIALGGQGPVQLGAGEGSVWLALQSNEIWQIDLASNAVLRKYKDGPWARSIAIAGGDLWVINAEVNEIWRFALPQ